MTITSFTGSEPYNLESSGATIEYTISFDEFLEILDTALALEHFSSEPKRASLNVVYDPARRVAGPDEILIGLGAWSIDGQPLQHSGICLNNKGLGKLADNGRHYGSVTDLVLNPPESVSRQWRTLVGESRDPVTLLARYTLEVEDIAPDSCFGLLCWLALHCGVDRQVFLHGPLDTWTAAVRYWESTGMADNPFSSWSALLSALSHSFFPPVGIAKDIDLAAIDFSSAWREALRFTLRLLRTQEDPPCCAAALG